MTAYRVGDFILLMARAEYRHENRDAECNSYYSEQFFHFLFSLNIRRCG